MKHQAILFKDFMFAICCVMICILYTSCASQATLSGGEKDVSPPKILKTTPENYTKNFKEHQLKIRFNEYVMLSSPTENIIINPAPESTPKYEIQGKSLVISFKENLQANKTYSILLLEAIKDITESNMLSSETIVFSTGETMDSCMISGNIRDAYTLEPKNRITVMLYEADNDSAPMIQSPTYYTYTNSKGDFSFYNLPANVYKLFALEDKNYNKLFDLPDEIIAFSDTLINSYPIPKKIQNSVKTQDSIKTQDSVKIQDSVEVVDKEKIDSMKIYLYSFQEKDTTLKYLRRTLVREGYFYFIFSDEIDDFSLTSLDDNDTVLYVWESNPTKDTIGLYFIQCADKDIDFVVEANGKTFDTITFNPSSKPTGFQHRKSTKDTTEEKKNTFIPKVNHAGEIQKQLTLEFDSPVKEINDAGCLLLELRKEKRKEILKDTLGNDYIVESNTYDTLSPRYYFADSVHRKWVVDYPWKYNKTYVFFCSDSVFISHFGTHNDTVSVNFKMKTPRDYGEIQMEYQISEPAQYIIQLITDKGEKIAENLINMSDTINYEFLNPGKYKLRVIVDSNKNNKWDSGKYNEKRQAETLIYFSKVLEVMPNWVVKEMFLIN